MSRSSRQLLVFLAAVIGCVILLGGPVWPDRLKEAIEATPKGLGLGNIDEQANNGDLRINLPSLHIL